MEVCSNHGVQYPLAMGSVHQEKGLDLDRKGWRRVGREEGREGGRQGRGEGWREGGTDKGRKGGREKGGEVERWRVEGRGK